MGGYYVERHVLLLPVPSDGGKKEEDVAVFVQKLSSRFGVSVDFLLCRASHIFY